MNVLVRFNCQNQLRNALLSLTVMNCSLRSCGRRLPADGKFVKCSKLAQCGYHYECASVSETTWVSYPDKKKAKWVCQTHRTSRLRNKRKLEELSGEPLRKKIFEKESGSDSQEFRSDSESSTGGDSGVQFGPSPGMGDLAELKKYMRELITSENRTILDKLVTIETSVVATNQQISRLQEENRALKEKNQQLELEVVDLQNQGRSKNLIISGIPEESQENLYNVVSSLSKQIGVQIDPSRDLDEVFRLPKKSSEPGPILVQCLYSAKRNEILHAARAKRPTVELIRPQAAEGIRERPIYVNEHLAPATAAIQKKCLQLKKANKITSLQVRKGKVFIKEKQDSPFELISTDSAFNQRFEPSPMDT